MSRYLSKNASDHGDFSTSFADLVFGLLFVFFLLAIAMVFNRPEVDSFQKKLDEMQRKLDKQTELVSKAQSELSERKKEIARLKKKVPEKAKIVQEIREKAPSFGAELISVKKEKDEIQNALNKLLSDYRKLEDKIKFLEDKDGKNNSMLLKKLAQLKANNQKLEADLEQLREQNKIVERHSKELQAILDKVKRILKQKGLTDILADVEKMEKDLKESERKARSGDNELFNDYKLWVAYDPQAGGLSAELWEGEKLLDQNGSINVEELLLIAKDLAEEYKESSINYTELEKAEHQPRFFLRVHPDSAYGQVQELLNTLRKGIPVSIIPWNK